MYGTGGCGGHGLVFYEVGLFHPVEIEKDLKCRLDHREIEVFGRASGKEMWRFYCMRARGQSNL